MGAAEEVVRKNWKCGSDVHIGVWRGESTVVRCGCIPGRGRL